MKSYIVKFQPHKRDYRLSFDGSGETVIKTITGKSKRKAWDEEYGKQGFAYPPNASQFSMKAITIEKK